MAIRYEMSNHEAWTRRALSGTGKYDVLANDGIVLKHVKPEHTAGDVAALVQQLGERGTLLVSAAWQKLFDGFFASEFGQRFGPTTANHWILEQAWMASGTMLTPPNLEMIANDPDVWSRLSVRPEVEAAEREQRRAAAQAERERIESEQIRAEMLAWLTDGTREAQLKKVGAHSIVYQKEVHDEKNRLANMSHAELVAEVTRRREVRRIKNLDPKDYRAEVTINRAAGVLPTVQPKMQQALNQYEQLPAQHTTRSGLTVDMNRAGILKVANTDSFAFRELVRRFGADAINDILAGRV
jgi:hypothetical protein